MWRQYMRAVADDPAKRVPPAGCGLYSRGCGMFRRYSPTAWAVAGVVVAGTIGYFMFYEKSRPSKREHDRSRNKSNGR